MLHNTGYERSLQHKKIRFGQLFYLKLPHLTQSCEVFNFTTVFRRSAISFNPMKS